MFIADRTSLLTVMYARSAEPTCLEAPNSTIEEADLAVSPILIILPFDSSNMI